MLQLSSLDAFHECHPSWSVAARKIKLYVYPHAITLNYSTNSELNSACIVYAVLYIFDAVI